MLSDGPLSVEETVNVIDKLTQFRKFLIDEKFAVDEIQSVTFTINMMDLYVKYRTQRVDPVDNYERAMKVIGK